jgi:hypothetical protein
VKLPTAKDIAGRNLLGGERLFAEIARRAILDVYCAPKLQLNIEDRLTAKWYLEEGIYQDLEWLDVDVAEGFRYWLEKIKSGEVRPRTYSNIRAKDTLTL